MLENLLEDGVSNTNERYNKVINEIMFARAIGSVPLALIRTYGCQQNVSDGEKIKGMLAQMGYGFTENEEEADLILFNTCAVREHAEDRVFGNVGALKALKRRHPSLIIALCGCMMEQEHVAERIRKSFPFVSLVFGTHSLQDFPELMYRTLTGGKRVFEKGGTDKEVFEGLPVKRDGEIRAWLPIMYGCDNFCSYCIVPHVRGRERSRTSKNIILEAEELIKSGYKDITLLGQNVNSYGKNLEEDIDFATLLKKIDSIEGDYWIRFMTSHPKDVTKDLIDTMAEGKHICKHLHLPFQSGSDRVLKQMNRRYTKDKYLNMINYAKERMPGLSITSDIIVGFPGETYKEFCETLDVVKTVGFSSLFTFIYSKRKGTPAAKMDDPISSDEKSKWFRELLDVQEEMSSNYCSSMLGKVVKVLVNGETGKNDELSSRTEGNIIVDFNADSSLIGKFVNVKIIKAGNFILKGELV